MTVDGTASPPPPVLPRAFTIIVGLAGGFVVLLGLRTMSGLIGTTFLALVFSVAVYPIRGWLKRKGMPAWVGSVVGILVIYLVLVALTVSLVVALARFATLLPSYEPQMNKVVNDLVDWLSSVGVGQKQIDQITSSFDLGKIVSLAGDLAAGLFSVLTNLFFVITLVLFMVVDAAQFTDKLSQLPGDRSQLAVAMATFATGTRQYLVVSTVFGFIVAVIDTLALEWIGVPVAILWGLLAFITNYIPNIGFVIGVIPPAVIGLLEGGPVMMIEVVIAYSLINLVVQTIIQPRVVGDSVGLSATVTFLSLVFWAFTLGAVGAVMAVPLTLLAKALLVDADPRSQWLAPLLAGKPSKEGGRKARKRARKAVGPAGGRADGPDRSPEESEDRSR